MKKHAHKSALIAPTSEEDARINAAIATDPDTRELTESDIAHLQPLRRLGRPPSAQPKVPVTMRVDADVLAVIKASGSGWQTRVNQVLREAVRRGQLAS